MGKHSRVFNGDNLLDKSCLIKAKKLVKIFVKESTLKGGKNIEFVTIRAEIFTKVNIYTCQYQKKNRIENIFHFVEFALSLSHNLLLKCSSVLVQRIIFLIKIL